MSDYKRWQEFSLKQALASRRVVMLTGPRQCGKTTLARSLASNHILYKTLDDAAVRQAAESDPHLFVSDHGRIGTMVIDEIQKVSDLIPAIKKVVDQNNRSGQFLMTGSANILTLPTVTESLAGRVGRVRLRPLSQGEIVGTRPVFLEKAFNQDFNRSKKRYNRNDLIDIIFRGGFPEAMRLQGKERRNWHLDYIDALVSHDLNDVMNIRQIDVMKDLVIVLAAWSSKFIDVSAIGSVFSSSRSTLSNYISALKSFYIIDTVPAWHKTDYDRVGKQNKVFMADTGMMTALLGWKPKDLENDPDKPGKAFETFAYNEIASHMDASEDVYHLYQYRDHDKREIDFIIESGEKNILAIEVKSGITVKKTDFKHIEFFRDHLAQKKTVIGIVLYAGDEILPFGKNFWAIPFDCMWG